jgi:hypothetical protein
LGVYEPPIPKHALGIPAQPPASKIHLGSLLAKADGSKQLNEFC